MQGRLMELSGNAFGRANYQMQVAGESCSKHCEYVDQYNQIGNN
jgi:hypothetical protein